MIKITKDGVQALLDNIKKMGEREVVVGIPSDKQRTDGYSNAEIAFINEFGSDHKNIPARPFLRPAIEKNKAKIVEFFKEGAKNGLEGGAIEDTMNKVGLFAAAQVKNQIVSSEGMKPLKQSTINARQRRRQHTTAGTKPLIDTGQMINSITYAVRDA